MSQKRDYYEILGITKNASQDDIKKAYRKLAMKYHPDRNPGDKEAEAKFKESTEAYEVLKDDQKKAAYDQYGHSAFSQGGGGRGGFNGAEGFDFNDIFSNFSDIFGDFGGGRTTKKSSAIRGADIRYNLEITLEEAFLGLKKDISFKILSSCTSCSGAGAEKGEKPTKCSTCSGSGKIRSQQGFFIVERTCTSCSGTGEIIKNPCKVCHGEGRVNKSKTVKVTVPAGVEDGSRILIEKEGEAGIKGGRTGDLYVFIIIKKNDLFKRKNNDIIFESDIKYTTAILGGNIEVPTIDGGVVRLKIPSGTQSGDNLALKSKGMSIVNSGGRRGDMIVKINVKIPTKINDEERVLLEKLDNILITKPEDAKSENIFKKISDLF